MTRSFFQAAVVSILLYGCTTWMLTKHMEKKLDGNYTRMLQAILNKSWKQHPHSHLPHIMKTIQVRRTRYVGHYGRSRNELMWHTPVDPAHGQVKAGCPARTYIQDVALKTYQKQCMIERGGWRGLGISMLMAQHDDDDDILITIQRLICH